jgi:hypothetical protein
VSHPASYIVCAGRLFLAIKYLGLEAIQSPPFSTEAKKSGAITPVIYVSSYHSA